MLNRKTVLTLFIAACVVSLTSTYMQMKKFGVIPETLSETVPDFNWQDFEGKRHNIKELSGHTVIIHFWATWCGPCRREFPALLTAAKTADKDVIFLTVSGDDRLENAKKFVEDAQAKTDTKNLPNVIYAFDPDKKIAFDTFQTVVYPESILVDKTQNMRRKFAGAMNWDSKDVTDEISR